MNELQLKPALVEQAGATQAADVTLAGVAALNPGAQPAAGARATRRRMCMPRLAPPRDDGFHLFRVY